MRGSKGGTFVPLHLQEAALQLRPTPKKRGEPSLGGHGALHGKPPQDTIGKIHARWWV